jgi:hypothetical protein
MSAFLAVNQLGLLHLVASRMQQKLITILDGPGGNEFKFDFVCH